jgi:hypothetical protein
MMPGVDQFNRADTTQDMASNGGGVETRGVETRGVETKGVETKGVETKGVDSRRADWPASHYLMTMPRIPEAEDDNPFE